MKSLVILSLLVLAGCAGGPSRENLQLQSQAARTQYNACVDKQTALYLEAAPRATPTEISEAVIVDCDVYFDLLAQAVEAEAKAGARNYEEQKAAIAKSQQMAADARDNMRGTIIGKVLRQQS